MTDGSKILHLLPGNTIGGISIQALEISLLLEDRGYDSVVVAPDEEGEFLSMASERGLPGQGFPYFLPKHFNSFWSILRNLRWVLLFLPQVYKLMRELRRHDPDVVHLNGLLLLQPAIAAWLKGVDVVWYLVSDNIYPSWLVIAVVPLVNRIASEVAVISESNCEFYRQDPADTPIVPGAIATDEIGPHLAPDADGITAEYDISDGETVITTLGQVHPRKGQMHAVEALASLDAQFKYLIVGPPRDQAYVRELKTAITEHGLEDRVHVTGFVDDKMAVLSATDIFLLPSNGEGTPLSIMEAMAMELPIIATDVGGVSEMLAGGDTGQLISPRSTDDILAAVRTYLEDPDLVRRHSASARERVVKNYDIDAVAAKYDEIYHAVLT